MSVIDDFLIGVELPRMVPVRQVFSDDAVADVEQAVRDQFTRPEIASRIVPGMSVAVGVGSRGLSELPIIVATTIQELKQLGAKPFIVPAMGSHGGATAEGQVDLLAHLGVTEQSAGCSIKSSMDTVELGHLPSGLPIYMDKNAMQADGIIVINRVKPHTSFSGGIESGLAKMLTIGLGKQRGAESCHAEGFGRMAQNVYDMSIYKLAHTPFLFGLATVENSYDKVCVVEAIPNEQIMEREAELLVEARGRMPRILFRPLDVLIVDQMGKEFSGTGMDPNITGRAATPFVKTSQEVTKMAVLDLTDNSAGNATGIGLADICTRRLFEKVDVAATYANCITSTVLGNARIPVTMETDLDAVKLAVKTCNVPDLSKVRMVRLSNTLHLETILISEALLPEAIENPAIEVLGEPRALEF